MPSAAFLSASSFFFASISASLILMRSSMIFSISVGSTLFGAAPTVSPGIELIGVPTGTDGTIVIGAEVKVAGAGWISGTTVVGVPVTGAAEFCRGAGSMAGGVGTVAGWPTATTGGPTVTTGLNGAAAAGGGGIPGSAGGAAIGIGGLTSIAGCPTV